MRKGVTIAVLLGVTGFAVGEAPAPTVETVLSALAAARGGAEKWQEVERVRIEGTWSMFSDYVPMTILRARPDLYRMDVEILGSPATLAFDGAKAWVRGAAFEAPGGSELTDPSRRNVIEDAPFGSLLLWYRDRDVPMELLGRRTVEGVDCWAVRVRPPGAPEETWFLDAGTGLEFKRVSRTFDVFSGPDVEVEMETFYMDFREAGGVLWPHREERHFSTRYNVLEIDSIEINPEFDPAVFRLGDG